MSDTAGTPTAEGTHPDGAGRPASWSDRAPWIASAIALVVVVVDQLSKLWAEQNLELGTRTPVLGDALGIQLAYNPGAAFSLGEDVTWVFTILAGLAMLGIAWFVVRVRSRLWAVCLGLLLGGAVTHFGDRLLRAPSFGQGHVVDFIAYFDWFIGNVADIALFVGAVVLFALTIRNVPLRPQTAGSAAATEAGTPAS
ncbi:signal peptidase II [Diaminobutyricimonas aerilata]|uniref:Lipoprotein signal peptidase n=1 Tax=Diaminobutyricimonas aerilata TaxID=1162967 RepID=A0A2M9CJ87_9MICO|nr:signal peptidase II [Diaminobutyricimonas aerilata]PJJ71935.1 signal peptidase II [Diaminobutyricimonas aerilata]